MNAIHRSPPSPDFRPSAASAVGLALLLGALALAVTPAARAATVETMQYDVTWLGVSVGTMLVRAATEPDGTQVRSIRVWNRPWIAKLYPVDNLVECRIRPTDQGPLHVVTKRMGEKNFIQDDVLHLWPQAGRAVWSNAVSNVVHSFEVPVGSRDFVSFFFDLRDAAGDGSWTQARDYRLVMDDDLHALEIRVGTPRRIRSPRGRILAVPVEALSKSPHLFTRNKPRAVWVAADRPVVVFADVATRLGAVRATLDAWELDGAPVDWTP
jgi:hypothetical protein